MLALASHPASFPSPKDTPAFAKVPANNTNASPVNVNNGINTPAAPSIAETFQFDDMEDALAAFSRGEFLMVMDDEGRENEGDLIIAADKITTEKMAWFIKHTSYVDSFAPLFTLRVALHSLVGLARVPAAWLTRANFYSAPPLLASIRPVATSAFHYLNLASMNSKSP